MLWLIHLRFPFGNFQNYTNISYLNIYSIQLVLGCTRASEKILRPLIYIYIIYIHRERERERERETLFDPLHCTERWGMLGEGVGQQHWEEGAANQLFKFGDYGWKWEGEGFPTITSLFIPSSLPRKLYEAIAQNSSSLRKRWNSQYTKFYYPFYIPCIKLLIPSNCISLKNLLVSYKDKFSMNNIL